MLRVAPEDRPEALRQSARSIFCAGVGERQSIFSYLSNIVLFSAAYVPQDGLLTPWKQDVHLVPRMMLCPAEEEGEVWGSVPQHDHVQSASLQPCERWLGARPGAYIDSLLVALWSSAGDSMQNELVVYDVSTKMYMCTLLRVFLVLGGLCRRRGGPGLCGRPPPRER